MASAGVQSLKTLSLFLVGWWRRSWPPATPAVAQRARRAERAKRESGMPARIQRPARLSNRCSVFLYTFISLQFSSYSFCTRSCMSSADVRIELDAALHASVHELSRIGACSPVSYAVNVNERTEKAPTPFRSLGN